MAARRWRERTDDDSPRPGQPPAKLAKRQLRKTDEQSRQAGLLTLAAFLACLEQRITSANPRLGTERDAGTFYRVYAFTESAAIGGTAGERSAF
jgi:hypothetical protein